MNPKARAYLVTVCLGGLAVLVWGSLRLDLERYFAALVILTAGSFFTQVYELEVRPNWFFSTNVAVVTTAVFVGGMPLGIWVLLLSTVPAEVVLRWDHLETSVSSFVAPVLFNVSQLLVSVGLASLVFEVVGIRVVAEGPPYVAMAASFATYFLANNLLLTAIISLTTGERYIRVFRTGIKNFYLEFTTLAVLAILMTTLYELSAMHLLLAFVPLALVHYSTTNHLRMRHESHVAFRRITDMLAERDEYTGAHSEDVEALAIRLADAVKLRDDEVEAVRFGAAIHDIGKIAIPDAILKKPGALTEDEYETMKTHTIIGAEVIANLHIYRNVVPIVRHEHEHWDGSGYPDGLSGEDIPIEARVVAVADVYSALTTDRAYRPPQGKPLSYSNDEACRILESMAGEVLDPRLVAAFVGIVGSGRNGGNPS